MELPAGTRRMNFNGKDDTGHQLASGVYFYRVRAGMMIATRKIVIAR